MKKVMFLVVFCLVSFSVMSQVSIFSKVSLETGKIVPTVTICGQKPISSKVSFTYLALVNQTWAEAQVGLSYAPAKFIQLGVSIGLEHNTSLYRTGASLWLGKGKTSFLALAEKGDGRENYWYKVTLNQKISENFSLGLRTWRYIGIGPVATYNFKSLKFWVMPTTMIYGEGGKNIVFGIDVKI